MTRWVGEGAEAEAVYTPDPAPSKPASLFQTLSFYFPPCGKIPPPVIMVQNVSFRYSDNTVSVVGAEA